MAGRARWAAIADPEDRNALAHAFGSTTNESTGAGVVDDEVRLHADQGGRPLVEEEAVVRDRG
jgi:hypothetical protein